MEECKGVRYITNLGQIRREFGLSVVNSKFIAVRRGQTVAE